MRALPADKFHVIVPSDLENLVPDFLRNRQAELADLRKALGGADFAQMLELSHRMKGVGEPYGFSEVSRLGVEIESSARARNKEALANLILFYARYLAGVAVAYSPRPDDAR